MNLLSGKRLKKADEAETRRRILDAAFAIFTTKGYSRACTLEIATHAKVSKRDLYALVGKKPDMLAACIAARADRLRPPADWPIPEDRDALTAALTTLGAHLLIEITAPAVTAIFRLAIAEADRAPEIARTLDEVGRAAGRAAVAELVEQARARGLIAGEPAAMTATFTALLWGDLMLGLLLRVADRPDQAQMEQRARQAAEAFLRLYPSPAL